MDYTKTIKELLNAKNIKIVNERSDSLEVRIHKGSKKHFSIPLKITPDLAYLAACVICDGHLKKDKYRLVFEVADENVIKKFTNIYNKLFCANEIYKIRNEKRTDRKTPYRIVINGKPVVILFERFFEIPRGKKSHLVCVPNVIKESNTNIKSSFLAGVFDTDGGKRGKQLGLTSASKVFRDDLCLLINEFNVNPCKDQWLNKKNGKIYYGLRFAGVPKWSKGLESFDSHA